MARRIAIVGGCGHVGLPLGIVFAQCRDTFVSLVDVNAASVEQVNRGEMHFIEKGGPEALKKVVGKTLKATTDPKAVREAEFVIFVTGTPVDEHLNPKVHDLMNVINSYKAHISTGQCVILRSTVYPGSTELIWKTLQKEKPGVGLAFCPERVVQGQALEEISSLPQIVSAFETESEDRAAKLFEGIGSEVLRMTPAEAELVKLFANGWRYIHFAIANQFYMIAESAGLDFNRIYEGLTYHYPRTKDFAKPGLTAGPCLYKDTMQLSAFHNNNFFLGHAAMLANEGLPNFLVKQAEERHGTLEGKKVGLLGMSFKANNDDTRESLSYKIKKILEAKMAIVMDTDPYQPSHARLNQVIDEADLLILGVPHKEYKGLNLRGKPFIDCWGAWTEKPDLSVSPWNPLKLNRKAAA